MGFSKQDYWSWLPFPSVGDLPNPGIIPRSPAFQADSLLTELGGNPSGIHLFSLRCISLWSSPTAPPPPQRFPKNPLKIESSLCLLLWNSFFLWFISSSKVQNMAFTFIVCPLSATTFIDLPQHKPNTFSIRRPWHSLSHKLSHLHIRDNRRFSLPGRLLTILHLWTDHSFRLNSNVTSLRSFPIF